MNGPVLELAAADAPYMAIRGPHAQYESRRRLAVLGGALAGGAAILVALFIHGDVYSWANGSAIGLIVGMAAIWICAIGSFVSFAMALGRSRRRPTVGARRGRVTRDDPSESRKAA